MGLCRECTGNCIEQMLWDQALHKPPNPKPLNPSQECGEIRIPGLARARRLGRRQGLFL